MSVSVSVNVYFFCHQYFIDTLHCYITFTSLLPVIARSVPLSVVVNQSSDARRSKQDGGGGTANASSGVAAFAA